MIRLHFASPAHSPTGKTPLRLNFSRRDGRPVLHFSHGARTLTRADWLCLVGATVEATTARDRRIVSDVLGVAP